MTNKLGMRCYVSGRVQGVWFRANTRIVAEQLELTGSARNLPDGRVEVIAYGEAEKLEQLYQWLRKGPERAEVTDLTREALAWREYGGFQTL